MVNIYHSMNQVLDYIENNLEEKIEYANLAKILGVNEYTMRTIFSMICNIPIAEYIRKRRLSNAGIDLCTQNSKIIDIAIKYQYDSATAFSRAFEKFYGVKPSEVKKNHTNLKVYPKIVFSEVKIEQPNFEYSIVEMEELTLYGNGIGQTKNKIKSDAVDFWKEMDKKYSKKYGRADYGMTVYEDRFNSDKCEYWILYNKKIEELHKYKVHKSKYLKFRIPNMNSKDIQKMTQEFYKYFILSLNIELKELPELEYYHDRITDFLVPIEEK